MKIDIAVKIFIVILVVTVELVLFNKLLIDIDDCGGENLIVVPFAFLMDEPKC